MKKKILNNRGFTLIELLAVIVILAVLMLLATPAVINIMNNARKNSVATEALSLIDAAKTKYATDAMSTTNSTNKCYGLSVLKEYLDKDFGTAAEATVAVVVDTNNKATYYVSYYNGTYSVKGNSDESSAIVGSNVSTGTSNKVDMCKKTNNSVADITIDGKTTES